MQATRLACYILPTMLVLVAHRSAPPLMATGGWTIGGHAERIATAMFVQPLAALQADVASERRERLVELRVVCEKVESQGEHAEKAPGPPRGGRSMVCERPQPLRSSNRPDPDPSGACPPERPREAAGRNSERRAERHASGAASKRL